jgi:hypothetical protein
LGPEHPDVAASLHNLAALLWETGRPSEAIDAQRRSADARERDRQRNLLGGSQEAKLSYLAQTAYELDMCLSLHLKGSPADPRASQLALETIVRRKGRALDMMTRQTAAFRRLSRRADSAAVRRPGRRRPVESQGASASFDFSA